MEKLLKYPMLLLITTFSLTLASCGKDDEPSQPNGGSNQSTIVNGIDVSLLPGHYYFSGNIAPHFDLYEDGTCRTWSTGLSTRDDEGTWIYDKESRILVLMMNSSSNKTYSILSLTKVSLTAEWSSVKYGNYTSTWERSELNQ